MTYVWCQQSNQIRCNDASDGSDAVDDRHDGACVVPAEVQGIDLHARVEGTHETHGRCEEYNHSLGVAAGVRSQDHAYARADRGCRNRCASDDMYEDILKFR